MDKKSDDSAPPVEQDEGEFKRNLERLLKSPPKPKKAPKDESGE